MIEKLNENASLSDLITTFENSTNEIKTIKENIVNAVGNPITSNDKLSVIPNKLNDILTEKDKTIAQLNTKYKIASGNSVVNSCVNKYGFYFNSDYLFLFPGAIQINGLNFVPNVFFTTFELTENGYFYKYFVFACRGIFTQDFVITSNYYRPTSYLKNFEVEGEVLKLNERDIFIDGRGIQLPCPKKGSSFKWQAIKFV
ncbi:hypothetical protein KLM92_18570 [Clostridioides difficile]|nr:hypothetical protein [Clostridioides difficile]MDO0070679.1 hypothetical protein [Clostridioides difficile]WOW16580.1 hypothetical protein RHN74_10510 [Clostridioides difficile]HCQ5969990.1 hypothetical protein [Clostridioides difficile]HCQ6004222.1 hypothetical protein [Clostridioides difficile]